VTQSGRAIDELGFEPVGSVVGKLIGPIQGRPDADLILEGYAEGRAEGRQLAQADSLRCVLCRDVGWRRRDVMPGEPGFGDMIACPCPSGQAIVQRRQDRVWQEAGIPPKFSKYTLDSLARRPGKAALVEGLRAWQQTRSWLLLWGPSGTCKSGAAVALLRALQAEGGQGLFMLLNRVLDRMQSTFGASSDEPGYQEAFKTLVDADLLILDDIGANRKPLSGWGLEQLFKIVDARDLAEKRTILTTNLPAGAGSTAFAEYVGAPTWSRIRGRCGRWIVETMGPDQRGLDLED
jgi:DNA replication protein DnaC